MNNSHLEANFGGWLNPIYGRAIFRDIQGNGGSCNGLAADFDAELRLHKVLDPEASFGIRFGWLVVSRNTEMKYTTHT